MFRIDERGNSAALLCLRDNVKRDRGFTRGFRSENLDNSSAGYAADSESKVESKTTRGDNVYRFIRRTLTEFHYRSFSVLFLDFF